MEGPGLRDTDVRPEMTEFGLRWTEARPRMDDAEGFRTPITGTAVQRTASFIFR